MKPTFLLTSLITLATATPLGAPLSDSTLSTRDEPIGSGPGPIRCGGFPGFLCPPGLTCVDDPRDGCDPRKGAVDCIGICVGGPDKIPCGGLKGLECPKGWFCVDDPEDKCDPAKGGRDCIGVCVRDLW